MGPNWIWEIGMFPEIARDDVFRLETRRLWLRWPDCADAEAITAFASQKAVAEMTTRVPHPYPKGEAARRIDGWRAANASGHSLHFVITLKGADRGAIGCIALEPTPASVSLGLLLLPDHAGQGLATEAAQTMVDLAFVLAAVPQIEASARVINPASRRVLEKCGFRYEGTVLQDAPARGGMISCDRFRLDRKTWASLKQWRMPQLTPRLTEPVAYLHADSAEPEG